jgi:AbrB family looped-hinge helix DNA binding protein
MKSTLDRFGRVVVPKRMRDRLGLRAGSTIEIEETDGHLLLRPADDAPPLVLKDGILIFTGAAKGDLEAAVAADRDERTRHLTGMLRR